ncbi:MAG TPA: hypothetical protein VLN47_08410, partial [Clostridiaceae bacterium]|nr:hypothetical protein [Clostridiaceae bacterium]
MKSRLGKALAYMGALVLFVGFIAGMISMGVYWLGLLILLSTTTIGLILLGIARVIGLQEEILAAVTGKRAGPEGSHPERNGIPRTE